MFKNDRLMDIKIFISLMLFSVLVACHDTSNEVVIYTTVDQIFSDPILKDFEKQTGIKVKAVFDTEETKSTGVLNRLIAEKNNAQCDVFWSGDPIRTIVLKNKGITKPYISKGAKDIPPIFKDALGHWTGFSARARVLIYNKTLLKQEDVPGSIIDLTKDKYKAKFTIANPLFGTTTFHIAALYSLLGDAKTEQFLEDIKNNQVLIATSNGDVKKRVISGQIACGLTDTDDAFEALKESKNIGMVFLDQDGIGSLIMPNTVSLINHAKNEINGKKLIDFLLLRSTEEKLAISCAQMPLHKDVTIPNNIPSLDHIIPMNIDYDTTSVKLEMIQKHLKRWVEK